MKLLLEVDYVPGTVSIPEVADAVAAFDGVVSVVVVEP